ncbi:hypothetical protein [Mycolicibacterium diernhoferi]|uniref:Uncharacterized protein n=1 Tax=Mycolicibacterium diernhoferi TaxID=1801 RepID=A0A1Q4H4G5_9MYCO|nr:hypothetical protein [Mycolicibacterium diernhoferi]OJZ62454.1 hypothetical protein BRW64_27040 [Mycolicibacterium diernhoferi]OPE46202.1 hypothetical protein BV510_26745 [Mycolicibacterium diernhoferi]
MRRAVTTAHAGLILVGCLLAAGPPSAWADPVAEPPEVQAEPWRTVFVDNPMILNPHQTDVESWSRTEDGLAVNFTAGPADCFGVHVIVTETAEEVLLDLHGGVPPEAIGRMCIALAVPGTVAVTLHEPLGERRVVDAGFTLDKPS